MDSQPAKFLDLSMNLDGSALFHSKMPSGEVITTRVEHDLLPVIFLTLQAQAAASIDEAMLDVQLRRNVDPPATGSGNEPEDRYAAPVLALMSQLSNATLIRLRTEIEAVLAKRAGDKHVN